MKAFLRIITVFAILFNGVTALAQPANDNCSGATNIGTLPTPGACVSGLQNGAAITLNNQTTVNATAPNPYIYQTACQGGGDLTTFALDTWYVFTATGNTVNVVITGFPNVQMALYSGTCGNLTGLGCSTNGTMNVTQIFIGQTYYLQVSGNTTTATDNSFSIAIDNDIDCNDCLRNSSLTATPPPVNGGYAPGQVVHFCYTVTDYQEINTNWFHGVQISMGPGWTGVVSNPSPAADCNVDVTPGPGDAGDGVWAWYPAGVTATLGTASTADDVVWPAGFYFDNINVNGTNAGNNFGDPGNCGWTFCWDLTVSNTCVNGASLNVTVNTSGDGESGSWSNLGCVDDPATVFSAIQLCCSATATNTGPYCNGGTIQLNGTGGGTYSWTGPNGFTSTLQNPTLPATPAAAGVYTLTINNLGCIATATTTVVVNANPTVSVNSPTVCSGTNATVTATPVPAGTYNYAWTVPGGASNPGNVASFSTSTAGSYSVIITNPTTGCVSTAGSGSVTVNPLPVITLTPTNPTVCNGTNGSIVVNGTGTGNVSWTGTAAGTAAGVTLPYTISSLAAGTYNVTFTNTATGCVSAVVSATLNNPGAPIINPYPNQVTCGTSIQILESNITGTNLTSNLGFYSSPNGVGPIADGTSYTSPTPTTTIYVYDFNGACTAQISFTVTVNPLPTVSVNSPTVCAGSNATVTATPGTAGTYSYSWTVPGGATNPGNVASFTTTTAGIYSVIITNTLTGCVSASGSGTVTINPNPTVTVNSPSLCAGASATVTATPGSAGAYSYAWTVPGGASAPGNVASFSTSTAGVYSVVITNTGTGCVSTSASGTVAVNPLPTSTVNSSTICAGDIANIAATPGSADTYDYAWTVPAGATVPGNVASFSTSTAGTYSVVLTSTTTGCSSVSSSGTVTVNANPTATVNSSTVCAGSPATVTATPGSAGTYDYAWTVPSGATAPGNVATFTTTTPGTYSVIITNTATTCVSTSASGTVTFDPNPTVTVNNPNPCAGVGASVVATPGTAGTYDYAWTVPAGASAPGNVATFTTTTAGTYSVVITNTSTSCVSTSASGTVTFKPIPAAPTAGTDSTYCATWTLENMTATGGAGTFNWYSNAALTSLLGTGPAFAPQDVNGTTVYYVTETLNGCEGPASTVTITIQDCEIIVPTAITPNGDGIHDTWEIVDLDDVYPNNVVTVYNRWGNMIYQSEQGNYAGKPWDGTYEGKDLPVASYYFVIDFNDDKNESQTGIVSIVLE